MQFKYINIRNMCGSNPTQFHLSQSSDPRYNTLSSYFHIQYTLAKSRVREGLDIKHSQNCKT
jgi:hypothetical protein